MADSDSDYDPTSSLSPFPPDRQDVLEFNCFKVAETPGRGSGWGKGRKCPLIFYVYVFSSNWRKRPRLRVDHGGATRDNNTGSTRSRNFTVVHKSSQQGKTDFFLQQNLYSKFLGMILVGKFLCGLIFAAAVSDAAVEDAESMTRRETSRG